MKLKAISFVEKGDILHGHYFYEMTLEEALSKMKEKGIDPIINPKWNIAIYPWGK